jgi:ATP-binding cassette subfamily F protein uup
MSLPVLTIHNGLLGFGVKPLFEDLHINILENDHLCLIGRNGQGKSTLLKVLAGIYELDKGDFYKKPHAIIHYLPQDLALPHNKSALDVVLETAKEEYIAQTLLDALEVPLDRTVDNFSGGQKRRVLLARALAGSPDVLLLDEPTNHLDIKAIQWLEDYLNNYRGALLTISHDRRFLANVTRSMVWLDNRQLRRTNRSYKFFDEWCEELAQTDETELKKINARLRLEEHWKQRGVTGRRKRNQGRLEKLMQLRQRRSNLLTDQKKSADMTAQEKTYGSQLIVEVVDIKKTFDKALNIGPFSTRIFKGDRIGIIGPNGCGKSTLLKLLMGSLKPDEGRIRLGKTIDLAYFDQERDAMNPQETLWEYMSPGGGDQVQVQDKTMHVVGYLKQFMFDDKQTRGVISILSGGEKNRLQLAKILAQKSNVLILDEPTNDLDMDTLDLLLDLLSQYEGTLILISHDRDFIDQLVTSVFAIHPDGTIIDCVGGYSEYEKRYDIKKLLNIKEAPEKSSTRTAQKKKDIVKRTYNDQRDFDKIPKLLEALNSEIIQIEKKLEEPLLYTNDPESFDSFAQKLENKKAEYDQLETRWLELSLME